MVWSATTVTMIADKTICAGRWQAAQVISLGASPTTNAILSATPKHRKQQ
jgi:hypothetical protein